MVLAVRRCDLEWQRYVPVALPILSECSQICHSKQVLWILEILSKWENASKHVEDGAFDGHDV